MTLWPTIQILEFRGCFPEMVKLSADDYFRYNAPFRQWLFDAKDRQLSDYKTKEAQEIFANEFVSLWNEERLPDEFYLKGPNMKTNFVKKVQKRDNKRTEPKSPQNFGFSKQEESRLFSHKAPPKTVAPVNRPNPTAFDKSFQKRRAEDLEELVPKKEGHAKVVEDRRIKSAYTRHERNPLDLEFSDDQLLSGSITSKRPSSLNTDDYDSLLRLEREKRARREQEIQERKLEKQRELQGKIDKHNQREKEVQEMLKKMIKK